MHKLSFRPKSVVTFRGKPWRVVRATGTTELLLEDLETRAKEVVDIANLPSSQPAGPTRPVDALDEEDLAQARRRLEIIRPLLETARGREALATQLAARHGTSVRTLRRWVHAYEARGLLSDLAPQRKGREMPRRLDDKTEAVIDAVIEEVFLTKQKVNARKAFESVKQRCAALKLTPPHENTFRRRLGEVSEKLKMERREGRKPARDRFGEVRGAFPGADYPLAVVQIDHTKLDIELVDDDTRKPIGRPWITLAIDVYSRMVTGFYLSLDPPCAFSVGMCVAHSANRKEPDLERLGIKGEWPVWGIMQLIHADNGKEFRSKTIAKACDEYGIRIEWRPVKTPHYGGHIERLMGTVATEIHALPGTTFSNPKQRGEYDPAKQASMTYHELERWLTQFIVGVYHQRVHRGIGCPPVEQWRRGIVGHGKIKGVGLPDPLPDPRRFWRDFLPYTERVVQRDGVTWDKVTYFSDALRPWIQARKGTRMQQFIVRRDPRDISRLYFLDPQLGDYLEIPYRDLSKPSISIWEYREAERFLRSQGRQAENEDQIFSAREELCRIVDQAKTETRKARRSRQRQKLNSAAGGPSSAVPQPQSPKPRGAGHLSLVVDNSGADEFDIPDDLTATFEEL